MSIIPANSRMSPRKASLWLSLSCLALVAGCKPGEGGFNPSAYLSSFGAPAPIDSSVLSAFFANALSPSVVTQTAALFVNEPRYDNQSRFGWRNASDPAQPLNGRVYNPLRSSGAAFAHAAGVTGVGATIAISDNQYLPGYDEFVGSNVSEVNIFAGSHGPIDKSPTHGTLVAAVALGDSKCEFDFW